MTYSGIILSLSPRTSGRLWHSPPLTSRTPPRKVTLPDGFSHASRPRPGRSARCCAPSAQSRVQLHTPRRNRMSRATDQEILAFSLEESAAVVTLDADFHAILAVSLHGSRAPVAV